MVCLDESPKQLLDYACFATATGQRYRDLAYVCQGMGKLVVATEPLRGWGCLRVQAAHKAVRWRQFLLRSFSTRSGPGVCAADGNSVPPPLARG